MAKSTQILLPDAEQTRLINRIEQDIRACQASHTLRKERFREHMQRWEARVEPPKKGDEDKPNHTVPLVQWHCFNKLARSLQALLGEDAEITAKPTGPSDAKKIAKIGRWMTSRVFEQMAIVKPLIVHLFRTILHGRDIYERPWVVKEFDTIEGGKRSRVKYYEGPEFLNVHPDDILTPPEREVMSIQDFSFIVRRRRYTIDELQRHDGTLFQGTSDPDFVRQCIDWAKQGGHGNDWFVTGNDQVRTESEQSEGVNYDQYHWGRNSLWVYEWYGKWRPLKRNTEKGDGEPEDLTKREPFEADWVVRYLPGIRKIIGVQDLVELYPKMRNRRPFGESSLIIDGTYWSKGFGDLLGDIEDEATSNSRLFTAAGELSVWPIVFFKPGSGMKPGTQKLEPGAAIPTEDPAGVRVVTLAGNMSYAIAKQQDTFAMAERVDGITDQSLGRSIDRPNAPKTATGQLALIEEGNVRAYLDGTIVREYMEAFLQDVWDLDCCFATEAQFFRVTEEQSKGLFDIAKGGAYMTPDEFGGRYDFKLKFATSVYAREAQAQKVISFYQGVLQNPLVAMNPTAMWEVTNRFAKAMGIEDFATMIPRPPELDRPMTPDEEWNKMLEGDDQVLPNPMDDDRIHLMAHQKQYADAVKDPNADMQAVHLLIAHIIKTKEQARQKMLMQALTSQLMSSVMSPEGVHPAVQQMIGQAAGLPQQQPQQQIAPPQSGAEPMPTEQAGSSAAPQPQEGML